MEKRNRRYVVNGENQVTRNKIQGREEITLEKLGVTHVFLSDISGRNRQEV